MVKQILPKAGEAILALFNKLGGNMNNVLGSRSNITFLGKGKTPEGFIDSDINIDAIGVLGKNKILEELESSMGYLTAGKLNDVQANKLLSNMQKIDEVFNPTQVSNITDMATGIRNLDQEGIASLRAEEKLADDIVKNVSAAEYDLRSQFPKASDDEIRALVNKNRQMTDGEIRDFADEFGIDPTEDYYNFDGTLAGAQKILKDSQDETAYMYQQYKAGRLDPKPGEKGRKEFLQKKLEEAELSGESKLITRDEIEELAELELPPPGSRGGPDDIAAPFQDAETTIKNLEAQEAGLGAQFKNIVTNKGDIPSKRASAREFLVEALKKDEMDVGTAAFGKTNLNNIISAEDVRYITEGGGGIGGDPLILVEKYFGPRIRELVPEGASSEEIIIFTKRVLENVEDAAGLKPDNPRFDRMTARFVDEVQEFAKGGRVAFQGGGMDASQDDFGGSTPSPGDTGGEGGNVTNTNTNNYNPFPDNDPPSGGGGDNNPFLQINPVYSTDGVLGVVPTKVGLEALLADKGRLQAILDAKESVKENELIGDLQFQGALDTRFGPVNFDAYADFDGQKAISANYNKDNLNLGGSFDSEGNKNISLGYDIPSGGKITADTDLDDFNIKYSKILNFADGGRAGFFGGGLGRLGKAGYQAIRKYGIEAEDITDLFKSLATDKTLVGKEKTEYFKMLNQVLKNPDDYPEGIREILMRLGKPVDFKSGGLAKILEV